MYFGTHRGSGAGRPGRVGSLLFFDDRRPFKAGQLQQAEQTTCIRQRNAGGLLYLPQESFLTLSR